MAEGQNQKGPKTVKVKVLRTHPNIANLPGEEVSIQEQFIKKFNLLNCPKDKKTGKPDFSKEGENPYVAVLSK